MSLRHLCVANCDNLNEGALCHSCDHTKALIEDTPNLDSDLWDDFGIVKQLIPFTNDFPQADIYQMISPNILHQLMKGTFKDHLMMWAEKIMDNIDCRIAAVTSFSGLWRFPQGCGFKQWTRDDSKAQMKVYLPAIEGHVPTDVVHAFHTLLDFTYLMHFHHYHEIFRTTGIISTFSQPCQHSLVQYIRNIQLFAALNGLCSLIMENKHIKVLDKLSAAAVPAHTQAHPQPILAPPAQPILTPPAPPLVSINGDLEIDDGPTVLQAYGKKRAQTVPALADELDIPHLPDLLHPNNPCNPSNVPLANCPCYLNKISVFTLASSCFYAPSNLSSIGGMHIEYIWSCPSWWNEHSRHDCVFVNTDSSLPGMQGPEYQGEVYPFSDTADEDTGIANNSPKHAIIHINAIYCTTHLIPVYSMEFLPHELKFYHSYDAFQAYYITF
ncbi:uncharacterized protein BJ212DRAFT_1449860 [Suillus subaureus]|uniref:Uncharacterized protein n=1 Tax=Suillus subaureus TaxID=48587 RepID=A0A9P7DVA6_9AGAM|nr:uncharacterized protein BJ212DRAFT_1449860 [Suillus subaureus]KAG1803956.1 hypothetical protein BJ212DRAFT_1449860 [Suillus subaureus]